MDPRDKDSLPVFQLETAMGAAIECFDNAGAIVVPRTRFAPVKTTSDLLAVRSDAYKLTADWLIVPAKHESVPGIDLDPAHYRLVDQLDQMVAAGIPSLKHCRQLIVRGPVSFNAENVFRGNVSITNNDSQPRALPAHAYAI